MSQPNPLTKQPRMDCLISHPQFGSLWLYDAVPELVEGRWVVGGQVAEDISGFNIPEPSHFTDWQPMWFPIGCVRKVEVTPTSRRGGQGVGGVWEACRYAAETRSSTLRLLHQWRGSTAGEVHRSDTPKVAGSSPVPSTISSIRRFT